MEANVTELEQYNEVVKKIVANFTSLKTIVDSINLKPITVEETGFKALTTEASKFKKLLDQASEVIKTMGSLQLTAGFESSKSVVDDVKRKWGTMLTLLPAMSPKIEVDESAKAFQRIGANSKNMFSAMKTGIGGVIPAFQMLTASAGQFLMTMLTSPVTWMILGIALAIMVVIEAFKMLSSSSNQDVQGLMNGLKAVGKFIMAVGKIIFNVIVAVVVVAITLVVKVVNFAREHMQGTIFESLKNKIMGFVDIVAKAFKWLFEKVDKFCGTDFSAKLNLETDIDTANVVTPIDTKREMMISKESMLDPGNLGVGLDVSDTTIDPSSYPMTIPDAYSNLPYENTGKEYIAEMVTLNAEKVVYNSVKETKELETIEGKKTTKLQQPNTVADNTPNKEAETKEITKTIHLTPTFNIGL